jgi:hypothetical protein
MMICDYCCEVERELERWSCEWCGLLTADFARSRTHSYTSLGTVKAVQMSLGTGSKILSSICCSSAFVRFTSMALTHSGCCWHTSKKAWASDCIIMSFASRWIHYSLTSAALPIKIILRFGNCLYNCCSCSSLYCLVFLVKDDRRPDALVPSDSRRMIVPLG